MTTGVALTAVVLQALVIAFLLAERWQERRQANPNLRALIEANDRLCQRLQAPQAAILEYDEQVRSPRGDEYAPPAVPPDDDEAFWSSRDKLAETLMEQEVARGRADG